MVELCQILLFKHINEESLTVYGNGSQTRSLCYVDDLLKGIYMMSYE